MEPYDATYNEYLYSPQTMTPPPEDMDCALQGYPPKQTPGNWEPPTTESLSRTALPATPRRRQSSISRNQSRRLSTATSDSIFSPREPSKIHGERAYVGSELQKQYHLLNNKLIRQYSEAEDELNCLDETSRKRGRQLRKQLSKLEGQMNEAGNNVRALTIRWSELCLELQSYETWAQTQWERRHASPVGYFTLSPLFTSYEPPWQNDTPGNTPLDAKSPEFVPRGMSIDPDGASSPLRSLEPVDEAGEKCSEAWSYETYQEQKAWEGEEEEGTSEMGSQRRFSYDDEMSSPLKRRLSLPNLELMWF